jgi:hypothetical protein
MKVIGLWLCLAILLISANRLPAPISEVPESPTPAPTPKASPVPTSSPSPGSTGPEKSWDRPHIYLQIADESQRKLAITLGDRLRRLGYTVMGIQNVAGNEGIPTEASELRFFTPSDSVEAQRIVKEVAPFFGNSGIFADLPEAMPYVSHARQYEIWFSSAFR